MAANAIDNSNMKDYRGTEGTSEFIPKVTYAFDAVAKEVDVTDESTFPADVAIKKVQIKVHDKQGGTAHGFILPAEGSDSGHDGTTTIDVSGLDLSKPLDITATVIGDSDSGLIADGGAYNIGAAGELGSWDKQKNAL
jgi:hypothetical protein